jgi:hypothetical protein
MSRDLTRTFHPWPPPGRARHCNGSSRTLAGRVAGHAPGRGARLPQVQPERAGSRVLALTGPWRTS